MHKQSPNGSLFWQFVVFWKERQTLECFLQWSVINRSLRSWSFFRGLKNWVGKVWWSMIGSCYNWDNYWYDIKSHLQYPLVNIQKTIENCPVEISWVFPWIAWLFSIVFCMFTRPGRFHLAYQGSTAMDPLTKKRQWADEWGLETQLWMALSWKLWG